MIHKEFMTKKQIKEYEYLEAECDKLNMQFSVGETVNVKDDLGNISKDRLFNKFTIVSGSVVAWLDVKRCYMADRVSKC